MQPAARRRRYTYPWGKAARAARAVSVGTGQMSWAACGCIVMRALLAWVDADLDTCRAARPARASSATRTVHAAPARLRQPAARLAFASGIRHGPGPGAVSG